MTQPIPEAPITRYRTTRESLTPLAPTPSSHYRNVIPIGSAKRNPAQSGSRTAGRTAPALVWSSHSSASSPEQSEIRAVRRQNARGGPLRRWAPTALGVACIAVVVLGIAAGVRFISGNQTGHDTATIGTAIQITSDVALVPSVSSQPSSAEPPPTRPIRFDSRPIEPSYTVAAGDNLWSIAERHRSSMEAIQSINNLTDRASLRVGQRLIIP